MTLSAVPSQARDCLFFFIMHAEYPAYTIHPDTIAQITWFLTEFLQRGANIATSDKNGNTALHLAANRGFTEVAKELLRWGADPHRKGKNGEIPMEIAINLALSANEENAEDYNNFAATIIQEMEPARYLDNSEVVSVCYTILSRTI